MILVNLKALFIVQNTLLKLLEILICLTKIEECARFRSVRRILALNFNTVFENSNSFLPLFLLDEHLTLEKQCLDILWVKSQRLVNDFQSL